MIRPLRKRHRKAFYVLTAILPLWVVIGLAMRKPTMVLDEALPLPMGKADAFHHELWADNKMWENLPMIFIRLLGDSPMPTRLAIELSITDELTKPDLLVYWSAETMPLEGGLPQSAYLLGVFNHVEPIIYLIPEEALVSGGHLTLYSAAYGEVVASGALKVKGNH